MRYVPNIDIVKKPDKNWFWKVATSQAYRFYHWDYDAAVLCGSELADPNVRIGRLDMATIKCEQCDVLTLDDLSTWKVAARVVPSSYYRDHHGVISNMEEQERCLAEIGPLVHLIYCVNRHTVLGNVPILNCMKVRNE